MGFSMIALAQHYEKKCLTMFMAIHNRKMILKVPNTPFSFYSFSGIGPMADLMSSSYLDKSHCYNSHAAAAASAAVYSQNYGSPHCYYGNMDYLSSSGNSHHSLSVSCKRLQLSVVFREAQSFLFCRHRPRKYSSFNTNFGM